MNVQKQVSIVKILLIILILINIVLWPFSIRYLKNGYSKDIINARESGVKEANEYTNTRINKHAMESDSIILRELKEIKKLINENK